VITTSDASIQTAPVDVAVVRIGKRQMTLSAFRQLYEEPIFDHDRGQLRGLPWGLVNYHDKWCWSSAGGAHLHVVWQLGRELRQCNVPKEANRDAAFRTSDRMLPTGHTDRHGS
jgi:hypothetical protein